MKKVSTIFLLLLLSFHWYGYRFLLYHLEQKADQELELRLNDSDYKESDIVLISTPLDMPYQNNSSEFERCYGEIIINGLVHTLVERRVQDGILILKCIPNFEKQSIKDATNDFFKQNNGLDGQRSQKSNNPLVKVQKNTISDFDCPLQEFDIVVEYKEKNKTVPGNSFICSLNLPVAEQPPDRWS